MVLSFFKVLGWVMHIAGFYTNVFLFYSSLGDPPVLTYSWLVGMSTYYCWLMGDADSFLWLCLYSTGLRLGTIGNDF